MSYTKYELETIINYTQADDIASVYTYDRKLIRRLKELGVLYPEDCYKVKDYRKDAYTCNIPISWIKINPPRKLSNEQRKALSERMKSVRTISKSKKEV